MPSSPAKQFRWEPSDPLARAPGEPASAHAALLDYAKRIGPDRGLEKLRAYYGRIAERASAREADGQGDLFGPLDAAPARKAGKPPSLKTLRGWLDRYRWQERVERWLGVQRALAESGGTNESARQFPKVVDSYGEVEVAGWLGWETSLRDGRPEANFLRIILHANDSRCKLLDLASWAKARRDNRTGTLGEVDAQAILSLALPVADIVAASAGREAADDYLRDVWARYRERLGEDADDNFGD